MHVRTLLTFSTWLLLSSLSAAAPSWSFSDGKVTVARKGDVGVSESFSPSKPLESPVVLSPKETLRLTMTLQDGGAPARPHQAFLLVMDPVRQLETFFPMSVKEGSGKAKVELTHKDLPAHLLDTPSLTLSVALGSFGSSAALLSEIGTVVPSLDAVGRAAAQKAKLKELGDGGSIVYGPKREIRHIFRADPTSPPKVVTLVFVLAVLAGLGGLVAVWFPILGGNLAHLPKALQAAPVVHPAFFAGLVALEAVFFMYYTVWNVFQTLGAAAVVGLVTFFSGSRALREVRARRVRGER